MVAADALLVSVRDELATTVEAKKRHIWMLTSSPYCVLLPRRLGVCASICLNFSPFHHPHRHLLSSTTGLLLYPVCLVKLKSLIEEALSASEVIPPSGKSPSASDNGASSGGAARIFRITYSSL